MSYALIFPVAWTTLGAIYLYSAYAGTRHAGILTLRHSDTATLSNGQRWVRGFLGLCFLGFAIAYVVLAYVRHAHHS